MVAHHPFIVPAGDEGERIEGAEDALPIFEGAGVDMILTGHLHTQSIAGRNEHHSILAVQAGTCISTRTRGESQSFNRLRFDGDSVEILQRMWDGGRFTDAAWKSYERRKAGEHLVKVDERAS